MVVAPRLNSELTWSRIYWPSNGAVATGPALLIEGAKMFCQYDFIGINLSVLVLGFYMLSLKSKSLDKTPPAPMLILGMLTAVFGPGAGLAWMLCKMEKASDAVVVKA